jgi:hypothetical protein
MRKIANTTELQSELKQLIKYAGSDKPSRARLAKDLSTLAVRVGSGFGTATGPSVDTAIRPGEYNLVVQHDRPTRWGYSLRNPQGGSFGTGSYPSAKRAIAAALSRGLNGAPERIWVIIAEWSDAQEEYVVAKKYWHPVPSYVIEAEGRGMFPATKPDIY